MVPFLCGLGFWFLSMGIAYADDGLIDRKATTVHEGHHVRTSFFLEARQCSATCDGYCVPSVDSVCCSDGYYCDPGQKCCSTGYCADPGWFCCADHGSCPNGYACVANDKCAPGSSSSGGGTTFGSAPSKTTAVAPQPTTTATATVWTWYYFTVTWYYYSWYYSYDIFLHATDVFSSTIYTTAILSISTSDAAAASAWLSSVTLATSFPTPSYATPLPLPTSSRTTPSSTKTPLTTTFGGFSLSSSPTETASTGLPVFTPNAAGRVGDFYDGARGVRSFFIIMATIIVPGILMLWL